MKNKDGWVVSTFMGACCLALALVVGPVEAAPTPGHSKVEPLRATTPRPPSGELMAKFLGFPPSVKLSMKRVGSSLGFMKSRPILAVTYANEKRTPWLISVEIHKVGSLGGPSGAKYEKSLRRMMQVDRDFQREEAQEWLIKRGMIPTWAQPGENPQGVEVRPGGRMVFFSILEAQPSKTTLAVFTTVRGYDVALIQSIASSDEDDPEEPQQEPKRLSRLLNPTKTMNEAFAQMERVMPLFSQADVPTPQEKARAKQLAREAMIRAVPAPRPPTSQELEKCLAFSRPVHLESSKSQESFLFEEWKPIWVMSYFSSEIGSQYEVELYPARSVFGDYREWFEGWLEHPVPFSRVGRVRRAQREPKIEFEPRVNIMAKTPGDETFRTEQAKQAALGEQKMTADEERLSSRAFTRVETRPDGRKVYFHIFDFPSTERAPVAFSTIGDYDLVLIQIPNDSNASGVKVVPNGESHRDVLQAFAELERLIGR